MVEYVDCLSMEAEMPHHKDRMLILNLGLRDAGHGLPSHLTITACKLQQCPQRGLPAGHDLHSTRLCQPLAYDILLAAYYFV